MTWVKADLKQVQGQVRERNELVRVLLLALRALNTAPRFSIATEDGQFNDSYKVAAEVERVLREQGVDPYDRNS